MTRILGLLSGSYGWVFLAGALLAAVAAGGAGGWAARGLIDAVPLAKQETATAQQQTAAAQCGQAREKDRADSNGKAAGALAQGGKRAAAADRATDAKETPRKGGYAAAEMEASNVPVNPQPALCVDPEPLRQLFLGMQRADAAASAAGGANSGGDTAETQHGLPAAASAR